MADARRRAVFLNGALGIVGTLSTLAGNGEPREALEQVARGTRPDQLAPFTWAPGLPVPGVARLAASSERTLEARASMAMPVLVFGLVMAMTMTMTVSVAVPGLSMFVMITMAFDTVFIWMGQR